MKSAQQGDHSSLLTVEAVGVVGGIQELLDFNVVAQERVLQDVDQKSL